MFPMVICRHYDVNWIDSHTCKCNECGKQGHWTQDGFAIWIKTTKPLGGLRPNHGAHRLPVLRDKVA